MFSFICNILLAFNINVSCQVDAVKTPATEDQVQVALQQAYVSVFGSEPKRNVLTMATAHVGIENGRGARLVNNNLGNIGASEVPSSGHQWYKVGPGRFLAHRSLEAGAESYWRHMSSRCKVALKNFQVGSGQLSSMNLRDCGYHRADVETYGHAMGSLFNEYYATDNKSLLESVFSITKL